MRDDGTHVPAASHVADGVMKPLAQTETPQSMPLAIDQPVELVVGSQTWQRFDGLRSPAMKQLPKIAQSPAVAACMHASVDSSHVSVVQNAPSSQGVPEPLRQWSAPSQ